MNSTNINSLVLKAVEELNQQRSSEQWLPPSPDTLLSGQEGRLDSLGLVNLILLVEEQIADELGVEITLTDERAMSQENSPFRSVRTLTEYVSQLVEEKERKPENRATGL